VASVATCPKTGAVRHHVFLLPGFFGFTHLGEIVYFGHVRDRLQAEFERRGLEVSVVAVKSHPTASIRTRARQALEAIAASVDADGPIHLVGHSTGGLDARLLLSPGADLAGPPPPERLLARVRTSVSVSSPHRGTPVAAFFLGLAGRQLLQLLSLFTSLVLRRENLPLRVMLRLMHTLVKLDDKLLPRSGVDALFADLLGDFSAERREAVVAFMKEIGADQTLMGQLTPDAMELFSSTTRDRESVRYGSVITLAPRPSLRSRLASGFSPYGQATHTVFNLLHRRAGKGNPAALFQVSGEDATLLRVGLGRVPTSEDSDGIVPTLSQPHGALIDAVVGDHLDAIGHFDAPKASPPHYDWLVSGSGFNRVRFASLWRSVADFQLAGEPPAPG